uniref:EGF-like domain-containing protein n=1 Tax=Mesocestoides corti TaxID=53468 RepID=A0A5K3EYF8_MESCO
MPPDPLEVKRMAFLFCTALSIASFAFLQPCCALERLSFDACCSAGINTTHNMELDSLIKESTADECIAINQVDQIFREVSNINNELTGDTMAKCLQVKRGCFYAAKANIFCDNAARNIVSSDAKLPPILHFYPDILKSPKDCCRRHNRLPALDVVSGDHMDFDINGVPLCCTVKGYEVPDDLDPFAQATPETVRDYPHEAPPLTKKFATSVTVVASPAKNSTLLVDRATELNSTAYITETPTPHRNLEPAIEETSTPPDLASPPANHGADSEIVCETGFKWHPEKQLCLHTSARCPRGMYLSVKRNMCLPKHGDEFNCPPGFEYRNDLSGCEDIDECKVSPEVCRAGYECRNVIGSFQCVRQVPCGFGYVLNQETQECEDIDECKSQPDICGPNMLCVNVRGGMKCVPKKCPGKLRRNSNGECAPCPTGYSFNEQRNSCEDINECEMNSTICRPFEKCTNRPGDYICEPKLRCEWGYQLNSEGSACEDVDECRMKAFNCRHGQICVNTPGSYKCENSPCHYTERYDYTLGKCVCPAGFQHRGAECVDIDECAEEAKHGDPQNPLCGSHQVCVNSVGAYRYVTLTDCPECFISSNS